MACILDYLAAPVMLRRSRTLLCESCAVWVFKSASRACHPLEDDHGQLLVVPDEAIRLIQRLCDGCGSLARAAYLARGRL
jgi:hypothetical protein